MAKTDYKTIDEYHNTFPSNVIKRMEVIRQLVHQLIPDAQEVISYQIPAFKLGEKYHLIYYSAYPKHISLSSPWSDELLQEFQSYLKDLKISKSVIQLPHDQPLPIDLIEKIIKFSLSEYKKKK